MRRHLAIALLALPLSACTNDRAVTANLQNGTLIFTAARNADGGEDCLNDFALRDASGATLWAIDGDRHRKAGRCIPGFPLRYGAAPPGFVTLTPARQLQPGATYIVSGNGQGVLRGVFRYGGLATPPENHRPGSQQWCDGYYRDTTPDWFGQCVHDNAKKSQ